MQECGEVEHLAKTKWLDEQDSQRHPGSVQTWSSVAFGQKIDGKHIARKLPQQKSTFTNSTVERWWSFSGERSANSWTCFHDLPSHHQAVILFMLILSGVLTILLNGIVLYIGLTSTKLVLCLLIIWSRYFYFYLPRICLSSSKKQIIWASNRILLPQAHFWFSHVEFGVLGHSHRSCCHANRHVGLLLRLWGYKVDINVHLEKVVRTLFQMREEGVAIRWGISSHICHRFVLQNKLLHLLSQI